MNGRPNKHEGLHSLGDSDKIRKLVNALKEAGPQGMTMFEIIATTGCKYSLVNMPSDLPVFEEDDDGRVRYFYADPSYYKHGFKSEPYNPAAKQSRRKYKRNIK